MPAGMSPFPSLPFPSAAAKPVVRSAGVRACWDAVVDALDLGALIRGAQGRADPAALSPAYGATAKEVLAKHRLPALAGLVICVTGILEDQRQLIKRMRSLGVAQQPTFVRG
jgi:hypothetical protein